MAEAEQTDLVESSPLRLEPIDPEASPNTICNFDGDDDDRWEMTAWAMGPSCGKGEEIIGQTFMLKYWLCHEAEVKSEDGQLTCIRTVLIDPGGNAFGFVSDGVYKSLRTLCQFKGVGPYEPAIPIVVKARSTGNRRFYAIEPAPKRHTEGTIEGES